MKRLIIGLLLVTFLFISTFASADTIDLKSMTIEELQALIDAAQEEINLREANAETASLEENRSEYAFIDSLSVQELVDAAAAVDEALREKLAIDSFDVPVGTWTVGKHLNSGLYSIIPQNERDNVHCTIALKEFNNDSIQIKGETESGYYHHLFVEDGDTIEVKYNGVTFLSGSPCPTFEGANTHNCKISLSEYSAGELQSLFSAIVKKLEGESIPAFTIDAGIWVVGKDIPAGTYDIDAHVDGKNGNYGFSVYAESKRFGHGKGVVSMYGYGQKHETKAANIELKDGYYVFADGCMATFTVSDTNVFFGQQ